MNDRDWLTEDDRRRCEARSAEAIISVFGRWTTLPLWSRWRAYAENRVWQARRVLDAYHEAGMESTRPDGVTWS